MTNKQKKNLMISILIVIGFFAVIVAATYIKIIEYILGGLFLLVVAVILVWIIYTELEGPSWR